MSRRSPAHSADSRPTATPAFISRQVLRGDYYFLDMDPPRGSALTVVCGGREACGEAYGVDRPGFKYLSIEYVDTGSGHVVLGGRTHPLGPGTLFRYGPDVPHRIGVNGGPTMIKYFVDFAGRAAERLLAGPPWGDLRPLRVSEPGRVRALFDELQRVGQGGGVHAARLCALLVEQLVLVAGEDALPGEAAQPQGWATYQRCRAHLERHCLSLRSLAELSRACGVGQAQLCRLFKRYGRASPYQVLLQLKMARAAALLFEARLLVKQVGGMVGYEDPYHFSKAFKRAYGVSPETFRAQGRGA